MRTVPINISAGLCAAAALALVACSEAPDQAPATEAERAGAEETVAASTQTDSTETGSTETEGVSEGAAEVSSDSDASSAGRIPANFHGVWDYIEGTCALESDLRMEISDREIMFYESIGTVTAAQRDGDDVTVTLAMEGEGDTWVQDLRLTLLNDGETRTTLAIAEDLMSDPLPRKRCEG